MRKYTEIDDGKLFYGKNILFVPSDIPDDKSPEYIANRQHTKKRGVFNMKRHIYFVRKKERLF